MRRYTSILVFLGASTLAIAQPLYKWVEPDGSITFSPKQPPAGTAYEKIKASAETAEGIVATEPELQTEAEPIAPPQKALPDPSDGISLENKSADTIVTGAEAPLSSVTDNQADRSESKTTWERNETNRITGSVDESETRPMQAILGHKQKQCQDLQKRVVSLERRLKTRLTPEDMDNTVVHMARYQRSYDQHCVQ